MPDMRLAPMTDQHHPVYSDSDVNVGITSALMADFIC